MSRDASVTLDWADGTYQFRLAIGQLRELQEKTGCGPLVLFKRVENGTWLVDDAPQILRLGLIGGGMPPVDALRLVRTYVEDRPPAENVLFAQAVLWAGLIGAPEEEAQKKSGVKSRRSKTSPKAAGALPSSMEPAAQ